MFPGQTIQRRLVIPPFNPATGRAQAAFTRSTARFQLAATWPQSWIQRENWEFETHRLLAAGYRVRPQWPVGAYRIDLVVDGDERRLAVECDGERWHTSEQLQSDLERQAVLQRLGWVFARIRGSLFFRDPDRAMEPVFAKLERLGIKPLGTVPEEVDPTPDIDRLRRRAEILRRDWAEETREAEEAGAGFVF